MAAIQAAILAQSSGQHAARSGGQVRAPAGSGGTQHDDVDMPDYEYVRKDKLRRGPAKEGFFDMAPTGANTRSGSSVGTGAAARTTAAAPEAPVVPGGVTVGGQQGGTGGGQQGGTSGGQQGQVEASIAKMTVRDLLKMLVSTLQGQEGAGGNVGVGDLPLGRLLQQQRG